MLKQYWQQPKMQAFSIPTHAHCLFVYEAGFTGGCVTLWQ